jgi:hypothetical protein
MDLASTPLACVLMLFLLLITVLVIAFAFPGEFKKLMNRTSHIEAKVGDNELKVDAPNHSLDSPLSEPQQASSGITMTGIHAKKSTIGNVTGEKITLTDFDLDDAHIGDITEKK